MKTYLPKVDDIKTGRKWYLIDVENHAPGRVATEVARILQGKHKPDFSNHLDTGDGVILINAKKIKLSGNKGDGKMYYTHSPYLGGLKSVNAGKVLEKNPTKILQLAVFGMLPKNKHRKNRLMRCKIFAGSEHDHEAQKPEVLVIPL